MHFKQQSRVSFKYQMSNVTCDTSFVDLDSHELLSNHRRDDDTDDHVHVHDDWSAPIVEHDDDDDDDTHDDGWAAADDWAAPVIVVDHNEWHGDDHDDDHEVVIVDPPVVIEPVDSWTDDGWAAPPAVDDAPQGPVVFASGKSYKSADSGSKASGSGSGKSYKMAPGFDGPPSASGSGSGKSTKAPADDDDDYGPWDVGSKSSSSGPSRDGGKGSGSRSSKATKQELRFSEAKVVLQNQNSGASSVRSRLVASAFAVGGALLLL